MNKKLDAKSLALAIGIMWSIGVLSLSLIALVSQDYLHNIVGFLSSVYIGYDLSFIGIIIGMIWGFFDAAIGGFLIAWLYNKLTR